MGVTHPTVTEPATTSGATSTVFSNYPLVCAFLAFAIAQSFKFVTYWYVCLLSWFLFKIFELYITYNLQLLCSFVCVI